MTRCGIQYGIRVQGRMQWFTSQTEAAAVETAQLRARVQAARAEGKQIIVTREQGAKLLDVRPTMPASKLLPSVEQRGTDGLPLFDAKVKHEDRQKASQTEMFS